MSKFIGSFITEARANVKKNLYGTPIFVRWDRNLLNEEAETGYLPDARNVFLSFPEENKHLASRHSIDAPDHLISSSIHSNLSKHYNDDETRNLLFDHTMISYPTNNFLWKQHIEPEWTPAATETRKRVSEMDHALTKHTIPKGGLVTYTGLSVHDPVAEAKKHPQGHLYFPAYTSTSIKPHVAMSFTTHINDDNLDLHGFDPVKDRHNVDIRHILRIRFPEGARVGSYLGGNTAHPNEYEFLAHRGMSVKLDPVPQKFRFKKNGEPENTPIHRVAHLYDAHVLGFYPSEIK